jgi:hypothetical protein
MLFVDYIGSIVPPNCNNRVYDADLVKREIEKIVDRFAKQIAINPWDENAVTSTQVVLTCQQK